MWKILTNFTRLEKILVVFLTVVIVFTSLQLTWIFYQDNTNVLPAKGGVYAEGIVGEVKLINPVFANQNPVDADIVKLVFAGLMKYNANQQTTIDDLAMHTLSHDKKTYTFTIRENAKFHDGEKVTADDVTFTFQDVIQNPEFKNELLRREFEGIEIKKIDAKTVTFTLPKPYKFFLTNLTIGILPKHLLFDLPVGNLDQSSFNQNPIGAGPFKFHQILVNNNSIDVNLKRFDGYYGEKAALDGMVLKIYGDYQTLIKNLDVLNGVRAIPKDQIDTFPTQNRFETAEFHLPQYIALFLNNDSEILKNEKVRLALQLATNREKIAENLDETMIIDDPLMEIDQKNWIYEYDIKKAAGGLFDAGWNLPAKIEKEKEDAKTESGTTVSDASFLKQLFYIPSANAADNYITAPNGGEDYATNESSFYITGNAPVGTQSIWVNSYSLKKFEPGKATWSYKASTEIFTLKEGENLYEIFAVDEAGIKNKIDEIKVTYTKSDEPAVVEVVEEVVVPKPVVETPVVVAEPEPVVAPVVEVEEVVETVTEEEVKEVPVEIEEEEEEEVVEEVKPPKVVKKTNLKIRQNENGDTLTLRLITSSRPVFYKDIAEEVKKQWEEVGIEAEIEVLEMEEFQKKVMTRDYDVLLYGQSLGYNLDAYPYWHSSQVGSNGLNLANYASFESDSLMEEVRMTHDESIRNDALEKLKKSMSKDLPAIFLYRPVYYLAYDKRLKNLNIKKLPTISDRFANIEQWYLKEEKFFNEGVGWGNFLGWIKEKAWKANFN